jgi:2-dehydropantoate 2-reductase
MHICIIGAGGVGCYYGARLVQHGVKVSFIARGEHLKAIQEKGLHVKHSEFDFFQEVEAYDMQMLMQKNPRDFDAIIVLVKAMYTEEIAKDLQTWCSSFSPYIISLQNGVENETILAKYLNPQKVIGGLSVKIGAHIIKPGVVNAVGVAQTPLGLWEESEEGKVFLEELVKVFNKSAIPTTISENIALELWKKLLINNGVNPICALLERKTKEVVLDEKLSQIVLGMMHETALAAKNVGVDISKEIVNEMFEIIKKFDSIKPSMFVDKEHNRPMELEEICGVVIRNCAQMGLDAPYTKTIATLLDATYTPKKFH